MSAFTELERLYAVEIRFKEMMPLFEEARDAIQCISLAQARLHNISLSLAERMDDVGIVARWNTMQELSKGCK